MHHGQKRRSPRFKPDIWLTCMPKRSSANACCHGNAAPPSAGGALRSIYEIKIIRGFERRSMPYEDSLSLDEKITRLPVALIAINGAVPIKENAASVAIIACNQFIVVFFWWCTILSYLSRFLFFLTIKLTIPPSKAIPRAAFPPSISGA